MRGGARLLTVTGLGGMGKTRFAVEAARNLAADFEGNVAYVQLASIADPELVSASIAQALGESGVAAEDALAQHLRSRGRLLLLVDNFEQVLDAAPLLPRLLEAPDLSVLVTSRAPLRVSGEHEYPLPPLQVDEAVTLFADRALGVNPHFTLGDGETDAVEELCARLEGLPLAIELAAARSKLLTPTALLGRLAGRLDLLAEDRVMRLHDIAVCERRSTGATSCSRLLAGAYSRSSRSSSAAALWRPPRPCVIPVKVRCWTT